MSVRRSLRCESGGKSAERLKLGSDTSLAKSVQGFRNRDIHANLQGA